MRIGLVAPPWVPVPPTRYGGTEVVIDNLARGLHERGHEVELFTIGESTCPVRRDYLFPFAVGPMGNAVEETAHVLAAYEALAHVDLIHDHTVIGPLLAAHGRSTPPVVTTHHGPFSAELRRIFEVIATRVPVVAISHDQAWRARTVAIAAVIHHGIDLEVYRPGPVHENFLVFVGRMSSDKGVDRAIRVARRAGRQLVVVTKMRDPDEITYFHEVVEPLLGPDIEVLLEPVLTDRIELMQQASALLNPIDWPEPFGLVMAEALACGLPVVGRPTGAASEIVDHGRTGFLFNTEAELVAAVGRIGEIDRAACRRAAEERFSLQRMAQEYDALYARTIASSRQAA